MNYLIDWFMSFNANVLKMKYHVLYLKEPCLLVDGETQGKVGNHLLGVKEIFAAGRIFKKKSE